MKETLTLADVLFPLSSFLFFSGEPNMMSSHLTRQLISASSASNLICLHREKHAYNKSYQTELVVVILWVVVISLFYIIVLFCSYCCFCLLYLLLLFVCFLFSICFSTCFWLFLLFCFVRFIFDFCFWWVFFFF